MSMSDLEFVVWFAAAAEEGWKPLGGSRREDDAWAELLPGCQPLSSVVASLARSASAMHDAMLALTFSETKRLDASTMAEATLARVAIESLATGLWLMLPGEADDRRNRYLSLMLADIDDQLRFASTLGPERVAATARKDFPFGELLVPTSTTRILTNIDTALGTDYILSWQLYSGLAHARPWAIDVWRRFDEVDQSPAAQTARVMRILREPVGLARRFLEVADLRRRFEGPTSLERERLERLRQADKG